MLNFGSRRLRVVYLLFLLCSIAAVGTWAFQISPASAYQKNDLGGSPPVVVGTENADGLLIKNDSQLPDTYPHARYSILFHTQGGSSVLHWRLQKGSLPPGLRLEDSGLLHGEPLRAGEFHFAISVTENGPQQAVQKEFVLRVIEAIMLNWKAPAHVAGDRIDGSVEVSNTTVDDIDLTFIVLAVAENGRATAIGYQRFPLLRATTAKELPFGDTLPNGAYLVHVDVVGEVARRNRIYRRQLQTPSPLRITVGP